MGSGSRFARGETYRTRAAVRHAAARVGARLAVRGGSCDQAGIDVARTEPKCSARSVGARGDADRAEHFSTAENFS